VIFPLQVYETIKTKLKEGVSTWNHCTSYYLQLFKVKNLAQRGEVIFKTTGETEITFYTK